MRRLPVPVLTPTETLTASRALLRSGLVRVYRPDHAVRVVLALSRYGGGPAMGPKAGATLHPDAPGILDDAGVLTLRELDESCSLVADHLRDQGLRPGDGLAILARNSRAFYQAMVGASRAGLDVTYLNTGFTPAQVADVVTARGVRAVLCDPEFTGHLPSAPSDKPAEEASRLPLTLWTDEDAPPPRAPDGQGRRRSRHAILTSGTTGPPKGASRTGGSVGSALALLSGLPYQVRQTHLVAAPMFHAWGWVNTLLTMLLSSTTVLTDRFDAENVLRLVDRHRVVVLVAVPTMLQRVMDLPSHTRARYDTSSLRVVAVSGSALPTRLAQGFMDEFGEVLYNLYGSTEAAFATVASPADLRAAPGTAGRVLPGVRVRVVDGVGRSCPPGVPGSIRVSSSATVEADADAAPEGVGGSGSAGTGDLGWFDSAGRLFVGDREDDMVVSGGENVYPSVVEQALADHADVTEVAVVGVPDTDFGQALRAHVVRRAGSQVSPDDLRTWCRQRLAPFQVPRSVVWHDALPRNETGKILKTRLRDAPGS